MSEKAWKASETSDLPKFYLDLASYKKSLLNNSNPYTPAVNLMFALDEALKMMREEGLDNIFKKHERYKLAISEAAKTLNLKLFASQESLSPAITAIKAEGFDGELFRKKIQNKYNIQLAGGQDSLKGKIFRVGHLGYINNQDIISVISAIGITLFEQNLVSQEDLGRALIEANKQLDN
tara:strand:- start:410 stop:946 length:537 start_codon:yes stop_codon:yes gene_type:complete